MRRMGFLMALLLLALAPPAWGAVAVHDASAVGSVITIALAGDFSYTVTAGATVLVFGVEVGAGTAPVQTVTSATWNTTETMTQQVTAADTSGPFDRIYLFTRVSPGTGTNNVHIVVSADAGFRVFAITFDGGDTTTPVSNTATLIEGCVTQNPSLTVTSAVGEFTVSNIAAANPGLSTPTQTQIDLVNNGGNNNNYGASRAIGAATVTHGWTTTGADCTPMGAISLKAAAGGAVPERTKMGVGTKLYRPRLPHLLGAGVLGAVLRNPRLTRRALLGWGRRDP